MMIKRVYYIALYLLSIERPKEATVICKDWCREKDNKHSSTTTLPLHQSLLLICHRNLTNIAGPWYFGRVVVPQRLINLPLYHKILLLQKFNDIGGKVLKQSIFSLY